MQFRLFLAPVALVIALPSFAQFPTFEDASDKAQEWFNQRNLNLNSIKETTLNFGLSEVTNLAIDGAFKNDPTIFIPLPKEYNSLKETVNRFGGGGIVTQLEEKLNAAAEETINTAKPFIEGAIKQLTLKDVVAIATDKEDGFTNYLSQKSSSTISIAMQPRVKEALEKTGTFDLLDNFFKNYKRWAGFFGRKIPDAPALDAYVAELAVDGLFKKLAQKELGFKQEKLPEIFSK